MDSVSVEEVIANLSVATSPETTENTPLFSNDIEASTQVLGRILDNIEGEVSTTEEGQLLPFRRVSYFCNF